MCQICKDWELGKLTRDEAWRNLGELINIDPDNENLMHYFEVAEILEEDPNKPD